MNPTKSAYSTNGLVAVVKGTVSKNAQVTYQIGDGAVQKGANNDGTFVIQVPGQLKKTTVTVKAKKSGKTTTKKVSVKKTKVLASYPEFAMKYNLINQQMKVVADPLPTTQKNGLVDLYKKDGIRIRANVQNQQVVGIAYVFPVKYMKNKAKMKDFAMRLIVLSSAVGADGKQVLKDYQKLAKDAQNGQTTVDNIHNKGVTFETNFSDKGLYMYLVKK
ncbi:hypothetical protein [Lapidilactobacillus bayanensis]|uniref:hypothetical protein n=1 Tax=Lapidilactobacillus bayanensis TaxID=2485998 RepID=UPI000F783215|nr:hypothetical protein [Lapidilactobacillus bayanensis]